MTFLQWSCPVNFSPPAHFKHRDMTYYTITTYKTTMRGSLIELSTSKICAYEKFKETFFKKKLTFLTSSKSIIYT